MSEPVVSTIAAVPESVQEVTAAPKWRTMLDSVNPDAVAAAIRGGMSADLVAGYVLPSRFDWTPADWARFPNQEHVRIDDTGADGNYLLASVIDVETGAATPTEAHKFIPLRNGYRPSSATVYADLSTLQSVMRVCAGLHYWAWVALWPNYPTLTEIASIKAQLRPGVKLAAIQYRNDAAADVDQSVVIADAWHRAR